jgi:hypothetical protein
VQGVFPEDTAQRARRLVADALVDVSGFGDGTGPVSGVRVRLSAHRDPAVHFPVVAQANLELGEVPVRAQAHAATAREAIALLQARLLHQLERASRPAGTDQFGNWRHPRPPNPRVANYPRPASTCRIVRYKTCSPAPLGVDQAVHVLECMDYDFHLFAEVGTGHDSVVYRAGPAEYRLAQVRPDPERLGTHTVVVTCYDRAAPRLDIDMAVDLFGMTEVPFLFFVAADSVVENAGRRHAVQAHPGDRGSVLYRRFDGHYGLISGRPQIPAPRMELATRARDSTSGDATSAPPRGETR